MAEQKALIKAGPEMAALELMEKIEQVEAALPGVLTSAMQNPRKYYLELYGVCLQVTKGGNAGIIVDEDTSNPAKTAGK